MSLVFACGIGGRVVSIVSEIGGLFTEDADRLWDSSSGLHHCFATDD